MAGALVPYAVGTVAVSVGSSVFTNTVLQGVSNAVSRNIDAAAEGAIQAARDRIQSTLRQRIQAYQNRGPALRQAQPTSTSLTTPTRPPTAAPTLTVKRQRIRGAGGVLQRRRRRRLGYSRVFRVRNTANFF